MDHTPEELRTISEIEQSEQKQEYRERPVIHRIVSWILIGIVLFGFLGTCYWLAFYGV